MAHRQRWYLAKLVTEVTIRTLGGKFWLRPDAACKAIVEGVFGKALSLYPGIRLHAFDAQSNHLHYLFSAMDPAECAPFLDYVHGNIARQVNKLRKRRGTFWSRRGAVIAVIDGAAQVARLRYILGQGPAAGLVASPRLWPGASSTRALLDDLRVDARYTSLDRLRRNAARSEPRPVAELAEDVSFALTPLPVWAALPPGEQRARVAELVESLEAEHRGRRFLGVRAVRSQSPHGTPRRFQRSRMPRCHASSAWHRRRYHEAYKAFRDAYLRAAGRLRTSPGTSRAEVQRLYPPGSLARPGWYIPAPPEFTPPWALGPSDADAYQVLN